MAVPHVAGVAALYLSENPTATPAEVKRAILNAATPGVINPLRLRAGTPNRLLYSSVTPRDPSRIEAATGP
jgi:serine protease